MSTQDEIRQHVQSLDELARRVGFNAVWPELLSQLSTLFDSQNATIRSVYLQSKDSGGCRES